MRFTSMALSAALLLAAGTASANIIEYDLHNVTFSDGGYATGYFLQDTADKAVPYYRIKTFGGSNPVGPGAGYSWSGFFDVLTGSSTYFEEPGPTSFTLYDNLTDLFYSNLSLNFMAEADHGGYNVTGAEIARPIEGSPPYFVNVGRFITGGTVTQGIADPEQARYYASNRDYPDVIPKLVASEDLPEPALMALLGIGLLGVFVSRQKRA